MHWPSELLLMQTIVMPAVAELSGQKQLSDALKQLECVALTVAVSRTAPLTRLAEASLAFCIIPPALLEPAQPQRIHIN